MSTKKRMIVIPVMIFLLGFFSVCQALTKDTHSDLNEKIARGRYNSFSLDEYLKNNLNMTAGIQTPYSNNEIWKWIRLGGAYEDEPLYTRSFNHFHDPLKPWGQAGYSLLGKTWMSSARWAVTKSQYLGNYSYADARDYFYKALTATDDTTRSTNYANCFRSLGQVMHLIQDASVPAHVRNDGHVLYMYEDWLDQIRTNEPTKFNGFVNAATLPVNVFDKISTDASLPVQSLFDNDSYDGTNPDITSSNSVGLAEYTNANFFSEDTVFKDYPYPSVKTSVVPADNYIPDPRYPNDPSKQVLRKYYFKTGDGDNGYPLAAMNYGEHYRRTYVPWLDISFFYDGGMAGVLDKLCYEEYAIRLIPRAVGYSKALLQYFFRGDIDAVDAKTTSDSNGINGVKMKVKNKTPGANGQTEDIGAGNLVVSYQYKSGSSTVYGKSDPPLAFDNYSGHTYEFTGFTSPIPPDAKDPQYMLVYRGKLGEENDAVTGKSFKPGMHSLVLKHPGGIKEYMFAYKATKYWTQFSGEYQSPGDSIWHTTSSFNELANHVLSADEAIALESCCAPGTGFRNFAFLNASADYRIGDLGCYDVIAPMPLDPPESFKIYDDHSQIAFDCRETLGFNTVDWVYVNDSQTESTVDNVWLDVHGDCSDVPNPINIKAGEEYGLYVAYKGTTDLTDFGFELWGSAGGGGWEYVTLEASDKPGFKKLSFIADHDFTLTDIYVDAYTSNNDVEIYIGPIYHGDDIIDGFDGFEGDVRETTYADNEWSDNPKPIESNKKIKWTITNDHVIGPNFDKYLATLSDSSL